MSLSVISFVSLQLLTVLSVMTKIKLARIVSISILFQEHIEG